MKPLALAGLAALALAACAPAATPPATTPEPAPVPVQNPPVVVGPGPTEPALPATAEAPRDWHLRDASDSLLGTGVLRAERELLAGRTPRDTVVVAVIDGGVDTAHVDLAANLWRNPREQANGRDDDGDGLVDDVLGWNWIGGADGENVHHDTFEVTRLYVACASAATVAKLPAAERERCPAIMRDYDRKRGQAERTLLTINNLQRALGQATTILAREIGVPADSLTPARVRAFQPSGGQARQARELFLQLADDGLTPPEVEEAREAYESQIRYGYNSSYDPRPTVGDDTTNARERRYGNKDVMGPDAEHGTHVAGIIGAVRGNGQGVDGIAPAVRIIAIRTVPDGDERDKDVANAIRYAVDHGARIINMSFGKAYSPRKAVVDAAVRYADSAGVLMIHAAGNDANDLAKGANFPSPFYEGGGRAANWIEVGATSWKGRDSLVASFSNYGQVQVDLFAPGVDILSTVPGGGWERESGTSMAAPVVSGVAALLMAHFPTLTAADVKRILLETATRRPDQLVIPPGGGQPVRFGTLSATGGVVNAYEAVKAAQQATATRP
jgi:subtilisin family serine protease